MAPTGKGRRVNGQGLLSFCSFVSLVVVALPVALAQNPAPSPPSLAWSDSTQQAITNYQNSPGVQKSNVAGSTWTNQFLVNANTATNTNGTADVVFYGRWPSSALFFFFFFFFFSNLCRVSF